MVEIVRENIKVTPTKTRSDYIGKKAIIVEAPSQNTSKVYVALSYDYSSATPTEFEPIKPLEAKFYGVPKGKKIHYIWYYAESGEQLINYIASDGSLARPRVHETANPLIGRLIANEVTFVERWEYLKEEKSRKIFFFNRYTGRSYPYSPVWKSECGKEPDTWTLPLFELNVPGIDPAPWNNVIHLRNSKDGVTLDEIYVEPRIAFKPPAIMRLSARVPAPADIPAGGDLYFGFEINSQSGHAIACVQIRNAGATLLWFMMTPKGRITKSVSFTLTRPNVYALYFLHYDPPYLRLWQEPTAGGFPNQLTELVIEHASTFDSFTVFIANEGTAITSGYYISHWAAWEQIRSLNPLSDIKAFTTTTLAAGATFTSPTFPTQGFGRIVGSCFADVAGTLRIEQRNDGANWDARNEISYGAGSLLAFDVAVVGNEARIVYVNGATAQATFRLYSRLRGI